jgi:hypothetical protein
VPAPTDDLFGHFYEPWHRRKLEILEQRHQQSQIVRTEEEFDRQWASAYDSQGPDYGQIARQLMSLRDGILQRFWDFWIGEFVNRRTETDCWNFAAVLLVYVCKDEPSSLSVALGNCGPSVLHDMHIYHGDMLERLRFKTRHDGLPHTPRLNQPELRMVMPYKCTADKLRGDIRAGRWRFPAEDGSSHRRRWRHSEDAVQSQVLLAMRREFSKRIWSNMVLD